MCVSSSGALKHYQAGMTLNKFSASCVLQQIGSMDLCCESNVRPAFGQKFQREIFFSLYLVRLSNSSSAELDYFSCSLLYTGIALWRFQTYSEYLLSDIVGLSLVHSCGSQNSKGTSVPGASVLMYLSRFLVLYTFTHCEDCLYFLAFSSMD